MILLMVALLGLPVLLVVSVVVAWRRLAKDTADGERVRELERRVSSLEAAVDVAADDPSDRHADDRDDGDGIDRDGGDEVDRDDGDEVDRD
ncbi:MAG: hypothetical protein ABEJ77_01685, partial [Halanaeroarchaeum sp.]